MLRLLLNTEHLFMVRGGFVMLSLVGLEIIRPPIRDQSRPQFRRSGGVER